MTPKEAIELLAQADNVLALHHTRTFGRDRETPSLSQYRQALATITHHLIPRTEPPTVEEVGDEEECVWFISKRLTVRRTGCHVRKHWLDGDRWMRLPEEDA